MHVFIHGAAGLVAWVFMSMLQGHSPSIALTRDKGLGHRQCSVQPAQPNPV